MINPNNEALRVFIRKRGRYWRAILHKVEQTENGLFWKEIKVHPKRRTNPRKTEEDLIEFGHMHDASISFRPVIEIRALKSCPAAAIFGLSQIKDSVRLRAQMAIYEDTSKI